MSTKSKQTNDSDDEEEEQLYTFDDVKLFHRVYFRDRLGWVIKKGDDVYPKQSARHLKIRYKDETESGRQESNLHERVVNKELQPGGRMWVDFGFNFDSYGDR